MQRQYEQQSYARLKQSDAEAAAKVAAEYTAMINEGYTRLHPELYKLGDSQKFIRILVLVVTDQLTD